MFELDYHDLSLLAFPLIGFAIVWLVPRTAARKWLIGLLIYVALVNMHALAMGVESYFRGHSVRLHVAEHEVKILSDRAGKPQMIIVEKPPLSGWYHTNYDPRYYAMLNLVGIALIAVFWRRSTAAAPGTQADQPSGAAV